METLAQQMLALLQPEIALIPPLETIAVSVEPLLARTPITAIPPFVIKPPRLVRFNLLFAMTLMRAPPTRATPLLPAHSASLLPLLAYRQTLATHWFATESLVANPTP